MATITKYRAIINTIYAQDLLSEKIEGCVK